MRALFKGRAQTIRVVYALLSFVLLSGCGILPKINSDPNSRTRETAAETIVERESSQDEESSETEEEILSFFEKLAREGKKDLKEMKEAFNSFFDEVYDQYVQMENVDLSEILDLSEPDCMKFEEDLQKSIDQLKASIQNGTAAVPKKLSIRVSVIATAKGEDSDGEKWGAVYFDVMPMEERKESSYEDYLAQYPSFLIFGTGRYFLHTVGGKWKIYSFDAPMYRESVLLREINKAEAIKSYYEKLWEQYTALEYSGLQDVLDETKAGYVVAEESLRACIDARLEEIEKKPDIGFPEQMDYRIHFLPLYKESATPQEDQDDIETGLIEFIIVPTADREEGMTDEEYLSQYPAFMTFEENCFLPHKKAGDSSSPWIIDELTPEVRVYHMEE